MLEGKRLGLLFTKQGYSKKNPASLEDTVTTPNLPNFRRRTEKLIQRNRSSSTRTPEAGGFLSSKAHQFYESLYRHDSSVQEDPDKHFSSQAPIPTKKTSVSNSDGKVKNLVCSILSIVELPEQSSKSCLRLPPCLGFCGLKKSKFWDGHLQPEHYRVSAYPQIAAPP